MTGFHHLYELCCVMSVLFFRQNVAADRMPVTGKQTNLFSSRVFLIFTPALASMRAALYSRPVRRTSLEMVLISTWWYCNIMLTHSHPSPHQITSPCCWMFSYNNIPPKCFIPYIDNTELMIVETVWLFPAIGLWGETKGLVWKEHICDSWNGSCPPNCSGSYAGKFMANIFFFLAVSICYKPLAVAALLRSCSLFWEFSSAGTLALKLKIETQKIFSMQ